LPSPFHLLSTSNYLIIHSLRVKKSVGHMNQERFWGHPLGEEEEEEEGGS
jgi:hypothetical protein